MLGVVCLLSELVPVILFLQNDYQCEKEVWRLGVFENKMVKLPFSLHMPIIIPYLVYKRFLSSGQMFGFYIECWPVKNSKSSALVSATWSFTYFL